MTDWPEDWFRDGAGAAGDAGAKQAGGAEPPTVRGGGGAADATSPGGRQPSADQLTQPVSAASPYSSGRPAGPGGPAVRAVSATGPLSQRFAPKAGRRAVG